MSDESLVAVVADAGEETAGAMLRRAREDSGMHIAALALLMKVPVKKLEALEADRFADLPDAVFVRALAASVCRTLKVDPAEVLGKLPQPPRPQLEKSMRGIHIPVRQPEFFIGGSLLGLVSRPAVMVVAALLLAILAVLYVPGNFFSLLSWDAAISTLTPAEVPQPVKDGNAVPVEDRAAAEAAAMASETAMSAPAVPAALPAKVASAAALPAKVASAAALPAKVASAAALPARVASATAPSSGLLVFKANESAWVRVSNSSGVVFEKTLAAGESAGASGQPPLSVVVGNAAAVQVQVRGKSFNLDALKQNNVARFEVK